jgi:cellulose synthase/poly-beta-1,6-N-acetylglucosamine synthase-like glycosyltransferase/transposase-like protein
LEILKLVLVHPGWSSQKISIGLPKVEGRPLVGNHGVQNVLERLGLNTFEKRKGFVEKVKGLSAEKVLKVIRGEARIEEETLRPALVGKELTPQQRLEMIERVVKYGESVSKVCIDFHISRPNFYKWLNRYRAAPEDKKLQALQDKTAKVERYYRQTPEKYEEAVLSVVAQYPEFGVAKVVQALPQVAGKPIVGHHGVQNVLRRHDLNTYEKRLAYAQAQVTPVIRLVTSLEKLGTQFIVLPAQMRVRIIRFAGVTLLTAFSTTIVLGFLGYIAVIGAGVPVTARVGLFFATIALGIGSVFFAYSMKYYLTLAIVLSFSRQPLEEGGGYAVGLNGRLNNNQKNGNGGWLQRVFGLGNGNGRNGEEREAPPAGGLQPSLDHIKLKRYPFVSIHLPFYNERKVAERILKACTAMDYPNFEIIVCDDSTDETIEIVQRYAKKHNKAHPHGPKIKIIHRPTRQGFKGGALAYALEQMNPKTEFCVVFDADFIPYPDTLELFIKYFKVNNNGSEDYTRNDVAVVGGYQWHVLNKSENWITRGVRTEYAGSYVIERPGREILGLLKQVSGAVYMIRADLLKKIGWGTSITEDFQLTLKLYEQGYRVVYTPYVQAPAECVSTLKRLIRQRMRWAEGHSNNIRKMFLRLIRSPKLTLMEKLELLYISPYYLQAALFLVGTFSWLMAETVFRARLPFWTSLWGWSLVLTNFFSLPLMNTVGLFLEESEEKDYLGLLSFIALSYILVPFQAYASVKGFLEKEEGPWFRTPKTGKITDIFTRGRFYRWISGILPGRQPAPIAASLAARPAPVYAWEQNAYVSRKTANNRFNNFSIKPKRIRWVGNFGVVSVSLLTIIMLIVAPFIPLMTPPASASPLAFKNAGSQTSASEEVLREEITAPINQTYEGPSENLEYIFHPEPRVRAKIGYKEVEITVLGAEGLGHSNPDKAYKEGIIYTYQDIFKGVDLVWIAKNGRLEEHFVLHEYQEFDSLDERIRLTDLVMNIIEGEVQIAPAESGHPLFYFPKPYMFEKDNPEIKSEGLEYKLEKGQFEYKLKKVLTPEGKAWLADPNRRFPVIVDPTLVKSTVTTGIVAGESTLGSVQRKIAFSATAGTDANCTVAPCPSWYVVYEDAGEIEIKRCLQSSGCDADAEWSTAQDIDGDANATHGNPSFYLESDSALWVAWIDDKGVDPDDSFHVRDIDTTSAYPHTLGTNCETADQGSLDDDTNMAYIAASSNGDLIAGYTPIGGDDEADMYEIPDGTCTFTSIETTPGPPTGAQSFSVVPVPVGTEDKVFVIYNDDGDNGDMRFSVRDTTGAGSWSNEDTEVATNAYNVQEFSATSDGTDIWLLVLPDASTAPDFFKCAACETGLSFTDVSSDPFSSVANAEDVSLSYNSNTDEVKAFVLKDTTNQQVYLNTWSESGSSWGLESSLAYTAGDHSDLSTVYSVTHEDYVGVVIRASTNEIEFSTVPEGYLYLLALAPFLPGILKKLTERRKAWKAA